MGRPKAFDKYALADRIRKHLDAAWAAAEAADLVDYRREYISIDVVCAPGEPEIYREQVCTMPELLQLLDLVTADRLVLKPPATPDLCCSCARRDRDCPLDGTGQVSQCGAHIPKRTT